VSIHWPILRALLAHPRRVRSVDDFGARRGYELAFGSLHLAKEIERRGASGTVGMMLPPCNASILAAMGCWITGRVLAPFNFLLAEQELRHVALDSEADLVITSQKVLERAPTLPSRVRTLCLEDVVFRGLPEPRWPARAEDDELATLLYTSGTSGLPKGVMLTHGNLLSNVQQIREWIDIGPDDTLFGVLPQFHSFGLTVLTLAPMYCGCRVVYTARFVPQKVVRILREHRPTVFVGLPSMFNALLSVKDAGPDDFRSVQYLVSGGEPLSPSVRDRFRERFDKTITEGYGLTETAPVTNWCRPWEHREGSVGRSLPGIEQRIVDTSSGRVLPPGREGEVRFAGPNVFPGYFKMPEATRETFDREGFFKTGDMGRTDAEGHLYITGRIKEILIIGGENVAPREIEEVLDQHPTVNASGVVGVPDESRGEVPIAFVEAREGATLAEEAALRQWCRERLATYKVPKRIVAVEELPRGATGKVLRRRLVDDAHRIARGESVEDLPTEQAESVESGAG